MSTTGSAPQGALLLLDPPETLRKKLRAAVTDSGGEVRRGPDKPGVTNLIDIMSVATGASVDAIEKRFDGSGYGRFKDELADAVIEALAPIQERYWALRGDPGELSRLLELGAEKAASVAAVTLESMYERMGFARPARSR
jgi:tryptophanyl-tRNA synthetase